MKKVSLINKMNKIIAVNNLKKIQVRYMNKIKIRAMLHFKLKIMKIKNLIIVLIKVVILEVQNIQKKKKFHQRIYKEKEEKLCLVILIKYS